MNNSAAFSGDDFKQRSRDQWSANPCGAIAADGFEPGSREYFDAIENYRYEVYAPWMKRVIGFDGFRGKDLLEIGCGTGTDLLQFARAGARVTGLDLTPRSVQIAARRFEVHGLEGKFGIGDAENLAFPDASFDAVYSFGVLHHTPETGRAVSEIHRVLRPGGQALVMLYHRQSLHYWGGLVLKHGVLRGELLRYNLREIMSRHVEYGAVETLPLVKAYTWAEARRMFHEFASCEISVNQLTRSELRPFGRLLPERLFQWLAEGFGWNLVIRAAKSSR